MTEPMTPTPGDREALIEVAAKTMAAHDPAVDSLRPWPHYSGMAHAVLDAISPPMTIAPEPFVYVIEGDEQTVRLSFGGVEITKANHASPRGIALLKVGNYLARPQPAGGGDWVLVPRELSATMVGAMAAALQDTGVVVGEHSPVLQLGSLVASCSAVYAAALSAAPSRQGGKTVGEMTDAEWQDEVAEWHENPDAYERKLTPSRQAPREGPEPTVAAIGRLARSDGQRTFDECIQALGLIDDLVRGFNAGVPAPAEPRPTPEPGGEHG